MNKKIVWDWEVIDGHTKRVKVVGGWLIIHRSFNGNKICSESSIFISDQHWEWAPIEPYTDPQVEKARLAQDYDTGL